MTEEKVVALIKSSKSLEEWTVNGEAVKKAFGGNLPAFWYKAILLSGIAARTLESFGKSAEIKVTELKFKRTKS